MTIRDDEKCSDIEQAALGKNLRRYDLAHIHAESFRYSRKPIATLGVIQHRRRRSCIRDRAFHDGTRWLRDECFTGRSWLRSERCRHSKYKRHEWGRSLRWNDCWSRDVALGSGRKILPP